MRTMSTGVAALFVVGLVGLACSDQSNLNAPGGGNGEMAVRQSARSAAEPPAQRVARSGRRSHGWRIRRHADNWRRNRHGRHSANRRHTDNWRHRWNERVPTSRLPRDRVPVRVPAEPRSLRLSHLRAS